MTNKIYIIYAILAAAFYALSTPISKILLNNKLSPTMIAGLLYLGAGIGMLFVGIIKSKFIKTIQEPFKKNQLLYIVMMIVLDILAPISLMLGLKMSTPENVALLNNFEIVATSLIALFIFKERISKRLWFGITLITISTIILSVGDVSAFKFSIGSAFVILACVFWGIENNCTRKLSNNDPLKVVVIKGIFSGLGSLLVAIILDELTFNITLILYTLLLGFVAYGLSVFLYVSAQRGLGASKTSAYYAVAPFISVVLSFILFLEFPSYSYYIALFIMILGAYFVSTQSKKKKYI